MTIYNETWMYRECWSTNTDIILSTKSFQTQTAHVISDREELVKIIADSVKPATSADYAEDHAPISAKDARDRQDKRMADLVARDRFLFKQKHVDGHWMSAHCGFVGENDGWESIDAWETEYRKYSPHNYKIVAIVCGEDIGTEELLGEFRGKIFCGDTANKCLEVLRKRNTLSGVRYEVRLFARCPVITSTNENWKLHEFEGMRWRPNAMGR